jgi:hypothetical protein
MFGKFPTAEFLELAEEEQTKFWATKAKTAQELEKSIIDSFLKIRIVRNETREGGTFLPLGVWGKMGFNELRIAERAKPQDIEEHDVLGQVYRLSLKNVSRSTIEDVCRMQLLTMKQNKGNLVNGRRGLRDYVSPLLQQQQQQQQQPQQQMMPFQAGGGGGGFQLDGSSHSLAGISPLGDLGGVGGMHAAANPVLGMGSGGTAPSIASNSGGLAPPPAAHVRPSATGFPPLLGSTVDNDGGSSSDSESSGARRKRKELRRKRKAGQMEKADKKQKAMDDQAMKLMARQEKAAHAMLVKEEKKAAAAQEREHLKARNDAARAMVKLQQVVVQFGQLDMKVVEMYPKIENLKIAGEWYARMKHYLDSCSRIVSSTAPAVLPFTMVALQAEAKQATDSLQKAVVAIKALS